MVMNPAMINTGIILLLGIFFLMIFIGFHICYAMVGASLITLLYLHLPIIQICNTLVNGINGFTFLAIPFFIISGDIMAKGGISDRLIRLANACVGWMRGGLAMCNVLASTFFGGISGSATADTASLGSVLIPMMTKSGYDGEFSTSITMLGSIQALLIPPSHNMIIYAMAAGGVSIGALFMAGIAPGILLGIALMIFGYYLSVKRNYPHGKKFQLHELISSFFSSILGLMTVLIVVIGVVAGLFTPTESAAIATIWAFIITFFVYREVKLREMSAILNSSVKTLSTVLILIAAAGTFGFLVAYLRIPTLIAQTILDITNNKIIIFLLINIVLLFLGMIMGMAPIIVITTPILLPLAKEFGMDAVHFGIMMILNCGIGLTTPPVGGVLFIGSGLSGIKMEKLVKECFPFYIVALAVLALVTYVPGISTFLPHLLGQM
jgi:tripartite ATP-independent transporter DctM subunit